MDFGFGPNERLGTFVVGVNEGIDVLSQLLDRSERGAAEGFSFQDREPDLDLVQPGSPCRCKMEMHILMTCQPTIVLGFVGAEVVEDDVDGRVGTEWAATMSFM